MLDISRKGDTLRTATAEARIHAAVETIARLQSRDIPKGDALEVARVAAIQAVKNTAQIIPFCHPLPILGAEVKYDIAADSVRIEVTVTTIFKTGVEMEALTGASVAALTLYDMLKMIDTSLSIDSIRLLRKKGGKSDFQEEHAIGLRAAVLVLSDSVAQGKKTDTAGKAIVERLERHGLLVADYQILPDEPQMLAEKITTWADQDKLDLVITTGGTGFSPRDTTPEAMAGIIEREVPGISEAARAYGQQRTPYSMLSRGKSGLRGSTLIVNLPGSRKGVEESLDALFPALLHAFKMIRSESHREDKSREAPGK